MKTTWYKNAREGESKEEREIKIRTAAAAFEILTGILDDKIRVIESERNQSEKYNLPGYPYYQADASGYIRALQEVKSLLDIGESNV